MTPTLYGRWQTRLVLLLTLGLLVTLPFVVVYRLTPLLNLGLVLVLGLGWDVYYQLGITRRRWDRDWPPVYQFFAGVWEGIVVFVVGWLLGHAIPAFRTPWWVFLIHYTLVWTTVFLASQSLMRIVFVRWRYRGGQVL